MGISVKNKPSIPDYLVLITQYLGHGMDFEMAGTHDAIVLYSGNDAAAAACLYAGYTPRKDESCVYMKLLSVEMAKHYKEAADEEEEEEEDFDR